MALLSGLLSHTRTTESNRAHLHLTPTFQLSERTPRGRNAARLRLGFSRGPGRHAGRLDRDLRRQHRRAAPLGRRRDEHASPRPADRPGARSSAATARSTSRRAATCPAAPIRARSRASSACSADGTVEQLASNIAGYPAGGPERPRLRPRRPAVVHRLGHGGRRPLRRAAARPPLRPRLPRAAASW